MGLQGACGGSGDRRAGRDGPPQFTSRVVAVEQGEADGGAARVAEERPALRGHGSTS